MESSSTRDMSEVKTTELSTGDLSTDAPTLLMSRRMPAGIDMARLLESVKFLSTLTCALQKRSLFVCCSIPV